jgi:hypothetical protein
VLFNVELKTIQGTRPASMTVPRLDIVTATPSLPTRPINTHICVAVQVCVFAFDCLYHNGSSLLHEPLTKRREVLHSSLKEVPGQVNLATTKISNDVEELEVSQGAG